LLKVHTGRAYSSSIRVPSLADEAPSVESVAVDLTAREKVALFCAAADVDHAAVGIPPLGSIPPSSPSSSRAAPGLKGNPQSTLPRHARLAIAA
jgi:hypothetical protein